MIASIRNVLPGAVAYMPMKGPYKQTPDAFARLYEWIAEHELRSKGAPTAIYFNIPSDSSEADAVWELQVQLTSDAPESEPDERGVGIKQVQGMQVVTAIHKGPYDSVLPTYQALWAWIEDNGYELAGPPAERYLNGPDDVASPDEYLSEIIMPIIKT
ncbi:MAG: GyrI-like domain-containing protein [Coriobacteriia bacterium]|nr:GyrI-like domain-containing protein [Coriobacteriia bacterium]MBN2847419.1 GyrI-like domain-containing protein [Coriobacteriia bacterium]